MNKIYESYKMCEANSVLQLVTDLVVKYAKRIGKDTTLDRKIKEHIIKFENGNDIVNEGHLLIVRDKNKKELKSFSTPKLNYKKAVMFALEGK